MSKPTVKDSKVQKSFSCVSYATITDFSLKHVKMSCKILLTTPYIYYKNNKSYISYINKLREFCNSFKGKLAVSYQFGDTHYQTTFGEGWTITKVMDWQGGGERGWFFLAQFFSTVTDCLCYTSTLLLVCRNFFLHYLNRNSSFWHLPWWIFH